jgi:hypothetical protein
VVMNMYDYTHWYPLHIHIDSSILHTCTSLSSLKTVLPNWIQQ